MKTIRELRTEKGLSQFEFAVQVGVTPGAVSAWERGKSEPKVSQLRTIAKLFGVSMDDIALVEDDIKKAAA